MVKVRYRSKLGLEGSFVCLKEYFKEEWKFWGSCWEWVFVEVFEEGGLWVWYRKLNKWERID